jgi:putative 4-mercaptohistidine N1-methyltranferase
VNNPYESDGYLHEYLLFHYGTAEQILSTGIGPKDALHFPARCVAFLMEAAPLRPGARALDIGCAVGGASFELARHFEEVVALDFSSRFIEAARRLQQDGLHPVRILEEGTHFHESVVHRPKMDATRIRFDVGDALNLPNSLGTFDAVVAANLIDRLAEPRRFLERLPSLVKPGGRLLLTSPYTWLETFTPRHNWLGGTADRGGSFENLQRLLSPVFSLEKRQNLPFLIREHARKFQWSIADATIWIRQESSDLS